MDINALYDLLKLLSNTGRELVAQQRGSAAGGTVALEFLQNDDVLTSKAFSEQATAHTEVWQGMPQAGISLSDVSRCCTESMISRLALHCQICSFPIFQMLQVHKSCYVVWPSAVWCCSCADLHLPAQNAQLSGKFMRSAEYAGIMSHATVEISIQETSSDLMPRAPITTLAQSK